MPTGSITKVTQRSYDNFEFMSLNNWEPELNLYRPSLQGNQADPQLRPWEYYQFSQNWTLEDAPNYNNRDSFSKTWTAASPNEKTLVRTQAGRTAKVAHGPWSRPPEPSIEKIGDRPPRSSCMHPQNSGSGVRPSEE